MKHALIVNHNAGSPYHGPNFRSYYAALGWVENNIRTTIVCSSFSHKLSNLPNVKVDYSIENIDGIRYIWLKTQSYSGNIGRLFNFLNFQKKLKMLKNIIKEPVNYVICSSPPPYWIWFCKKFADSKKASLIFEARDLWPDVIFETTRTGKFNPAAWLMRAAEMYAYKKADSVVSVNESAIEIMKKRGLSVSKFSTISNGVRTEKDIKNVNSEMINTLCKKLKKEKKFIVGYAGSLSKVYGLAYLAESAKLLKNENVAFLLAGNGVYENELKKMSNLLPNFHLIGWIPKTELNYFLKSVDICYAGLLNVPSFAFGSDSTKVYEYMKAVRPVIHAIGDENSVVVRAKCGIRIPPENSGALAEGIKTMMNLSNNILKTMGENGFKYLQDKRSYNVLNKKWIDLFCHLDGNSI